MITKWFSAWFFYCCSAIASIGLLLYQIYNGMYVSRSIYLVVAIGVVMLIKWEYDKKK